jgi:hypothetical protein
MTSQGKEPNEKGPRHISKRPLFNGFDFLTDDDDDEYVPSDEEASPTGNEFLEIFKRTRAKHPLTHVDLTRLERMTSKGVYLIHGIVQLSSNEFPLIPQIICLIHRRIAPARW